MTYKEKLNECLAAIKNGDQTKYAELHHLTYGPLKSVAQSYLINKSYAEAVMSDLYLKIYLYADHYDTSQDAQVYLWQIVKNIAFTYNKKHIKNKTVNLDSVQIADEIDLYENADVKIDVDRALKRVGAINALIFIWTCRDGLTQEEIAERLRITKSAVCQRLNKTLEKLEKFLK